MKTWRFMGLLAAGCAPAGGVGSLGDPSEGQCSAGRLENLVRQPASEALGQQALRRSGARTLRWIGPGDMVTMDYLPTRLNIHLDAQGRIDRLSCG